MSLELCNYAFLYKYRQISEFYFIRAGELVKIISPLNLPEFVSKTRFEARKDVTPKIGQK